MENLPKGMSKDVDRKRKTSETELKNSKTIKIYPLAERFKEQEAELQKKDEIIRNLQLENRKVKLELRSCLTVLKRVDQAKQDFFSKERALKMYAKVKKELAEKETVIQDLQESKNLLTAKLKSFETQHEEACKKIREEESTKHAKEYAEKVGKLERSEEDLRGKLKRALNELDVQAEELNKNEEELERIQEKYNRIQKEGFDRLLKMNKDLIEQLESVKETERKRWEAGYNRLRLEKRYREEVKDGEGKEVKKKIKRNGRL